MVRPPERWLGLSHAAFLLLFRGAAAGTGARHARALLRRSAPRPVWAGDGPSGIQDMLGPASAPLEECLTPIYPGTEGVAQGRMRALIRQALGELDSAGVRDWIPARTFWHAARAAVIAGSARLRAPPAAQECASRNWPPDATRAQRRLAFEELLAHHLSLKNSEALRADGSHLDGH